MRKLFALSAAILLLTISSFSQSQSTTGNIEGRIVDPNGAVVPGVSITATNVDNGSSKTVTSDADGNYIFVLLQPGNYKVEVKSASGFAGATYNNVAVTVGARTPRTR